VREDGVRASESRKAAGRQKSAGKEQAVCVKRERKRKREE